MNVANQADKKGDKAGGTYDGARENTKVYTLKNMTMFTQERL